MVCFINVIISGRTIATIAWLSIFMGVVGCKQPPLRPLSPELDSQAQARSKRSPEEPAAAEERENTATKTRQLNGTGTDPDDPYNLKSPPSDEEYKKRRDEYLARIRAGEGYLPKGYRKDEPPRLTLTNPTDGTVVNIAIPADVLINLRSILAIDEENERILLDMDYTINWLDAKILDFEFLGRIDKPEFISMPKIFLDKVWLPDIYLDNLVELNQLKFMEAPIAVAFDPVVGMIQYRQRLVPNVKCGMDFHYYPADTQICEFSLRSYSYSTKDMIIQWAKPLGIFFQDPSDANFDLRIDDIEEVTVPEEMHYHGSNNSYRTLRFKLYAKRKLSYHLIQTYIPSVFFVVITWLCFLLPQSMVEARIGITMTTLLTVTAMFAAVRESTPTVSYAKAIDVWMSVCILFIFLTLFEFSIMVWINWKKDQAVAQQAEVVQVQTDPSQARMLKRQNMNDMNMVMVRTMAVASKNSSRIRCFEAAGETIEKFALPIYAISFLVFAVAYWIWLLHAADYLRWVVNPEFNKIEE